VETAAKTLISQANQNGGEDNITVVVVRITD
jgi:serine/threonine protein phosphatase PrpC